jgi:hypothetical protein
MKAGNAKLIGFVLFLLSLVGCGGTGGSPNPPARPTSDILSAAPGMPILTATPELECETYRIHWQTTVEEYEWSVWVLENIETGVTQSDEVERLLGEPTGESYQTWIYDTGLGEVLLHVHFGEDGVVDLMDLWAPMTLGQLIETYGDPSGVYRVRDIDDPTDAFPGVVLVYEEHYLYAILQQGICLFPSQINVDAIELGPLYFRDLSLSPDAVEVEWPGLTN